MPAPAAIAVRQVTKFFSRIQARTRRPVLQAISFDIALGEFFVILGPSGSGKSTLLRIIRGLETPDHGTVALGEGMTAQDIGFVFQQFALLPWLTVADNIGLGLDRHRLTTGQREQRIQEELTRFGLEKFARAYPRELSGGMRQRVGLARALATDPKVVLMDEPFSELDSFTAAQLRQELLAIWQQHHLTIVLVTHLVSEAVELADRIAVLTPRPGRIETIVTNGLPRPRSRRSPVALQLEDQLMGLVRP